MESPCRFRMTCCGFLGAPDRELVRQGQRLEDGADIVSRDSGRIIREDVLNEHPMLRQ